MDAMMRRVDVALGERSYEIAVGPGLLDDIGRHVRQLATTGQVGVVADTTVANLYARRVMRSLKAAGCNPHLILLPAGERTKTLRSASRVLDGLVKAKFERGSVLIALGGGVIGDLTGFVAAVYLRGIPYIQVPTTLIAQVDSSVGGKTGVNHPSGKNLIGAFHQPRLVLIDIQTLNTLPRREWTAGLAEVIKYGVIADDKFFAFLEEHLPSVLEMKDEAVMHLVTRSCEIKAAVVMEDERESDRRRILNYGHTIGHALESLGRYRGLVHGEAVAIGMVQEADLAACLGLCGADVVQRQRDLIRRCGLPHELPRVSFGDLWRAMQHDKKVAGGRLHCVLPERIGSVRVEVLERAGCRQWFGRRQARRPVRASARPLSGCMERGG